MEVDLEPEANPESEGVEFSLEREANIHHVTFVTIAGPPKGGEI